MKTKDENEFYDLAAKLLNSTRPKTKTAWKAFFEVMVRELYVNGMVYLPLVGCFRLQHLEAGIQKQVDSKGVVHWYQVPERDRPVFIPEDDFINDINMHGVTKSYRRRIKQNARTLRDNERYRRLQEIIGEYPEIPEREAARQVQLADDFDELIKKKRQDYEDKLKQIAKEASDESK